MKRNVDLTENMLFGDKPALDVSELLAMGGKIKTPWNIYFNIINSDNELDLSHQKKSLITLGDKKQRAEIASYREMDSDEYCDCCGEKIKIPWNLCYRLCEKCNRHLEDEVQGVQKCLWRKIDGKEESISSQSAFINTLF